MTKEKIQECKDCLKDAMWDLQKYCRKHYNSDIEYVKQCIQNALEILNEEQE